MADIPIVVKPDGGLGDLQADEDGRLKVAAEVDGTGGEALAREATLQEVRDRLPEPAATVLPINAEGLPTRVIGTVPVSDVNATYETGLPAADASGLVTREAPTGQLDMASSKSVTIASNQTAIPVTGRVNLAGSGFEISATETEPGVFGLDIAVKETALAPDAARESKQDETIAAIQNVDSKIPFPVDDQMPVVAASTDAAIASLVAEVADDATTGDVQEVRDRLPGVLGAGGGLKVEGVVGGQAVAVSDGGSSLTVDGVVQATGAGGAALALNTSVDDIEGKLGASVAQEVTAASTLAAVDTLETLGAAGNANTSAINTKLLAALGTAFAAPVRATATNVAAQLPSTSYGRGFVVENIDTANDLYVGPSNAVTTSNGFRISPSRSRRFDLPNSNLLWVISASTTAYQIGATT